MAGGGEVTFACVLLALLFATHAQAAPEKVEHVSYGSVIKLQHEVTSMRLHSHNINYGQGSGQQSVTAIAFTHDPNSFWIVKHAAGEAMPPQGTPVRCGAVIRLEHLNTGANLHSHLVPAALSRKWEVSAFGFREESGDSGDNMKLHCDGNRKDGGDDVWQRFEKVSLQHVDTGFFLVTSSKYQYGEPVRGQQEVYTTEKISPHAFWRSNEGFYFVNNES